jgi:hypothetical protein
MLPGLAYAHENKEQLRPYTLIVEEGRIFKCKLGLLLEEVTMSAGNANPK